MGKARWRSHPTGPDWLARPVVALCRSVFGRAEFSAAIASTEAPADTVSAPRTSAVLPVRQLRVRIGAAPSTIDIAPARRSGMADQRGGEAKHHEQWEASGVRSP